MRNSHVLVHSTTYARERTHSNSSITRPKNIRTYLAFLESCITQRISEEQDVQRGAVEKAKIRKDMFHHIYHAKDAETGKADLLGEIDLLTAAGTDTTSTALAAIFFYLTRNQVAYGKLSAEIRETFARAEDIHAGPQLTSCRYLRACIDE